MVSGRCHHIRITRYISTVRFVNWPCQECPYYVLLRAQHSQLYSTTGWCISVRHYQIYIGVWVECCQLIWLLGHDLYSLPLGLQIASLFLGSSPWHTEHKASKDDTFHQYLNDSNLWWTSSFFRFQCHQPWWHPIISVDNQCDVIFSIKSMYCKQFF